MDRLKTFAKYAIWIILFWIFSDILIYAGINSTYKDMQMKGTVPNGVQVVQMQSTKVNGKIKLQVDQPELSGKYLKIELYSESGKILGEEYLEIGTITEGKSKSIEKYFKITDVKSYNISVVDQPGESSEGFMDTAMSTITIALLLIKILIL